ncbi:DUF6089 family protein [Aquirufa sp. OSTEICH-129V]|uniref:DUF6089 family protein n=1 Tax=Aquirufa avitistagni TaxID=3104728 RepID=A0ABW6DDX4_9BACT
MRLFLLVCLCLIGLPSMAQNPFWFLGQRDGRYVDKFDAHSSVSLGVGTTNYVGDLAPLGGLTQVGIQSMRWNLGAQFTRHFSKNFSARFGLSYVRLAGDDNYFDQSGDFAGSYYRNLHFKNDLKELTVLGVFELMGNKEFIRKRPQFAPYIMAGIAAYSHDPMARKDANVSNGTVTKSGWISLHGQNTPSEGNSYSLVGLALPVGVGFRYRLTDDFDVSFELMHRVAFSDYLDDVSDNRMNPELVAPATSFYTNRSTLPIAPNTLAVRNISNPNIPSVFSWGLDQYFTTQIQLVYHIPKK